MAAILWHSVAPWSPSAFGGQTRLFVRSLRAAGVDVLLSADAGLAGECTWEGHVVRASPADVEGSLTDWAGPLVEGGEVDVVVTLVDAFRLLGQRGLSRTLSWIPVHATPPEDPVVRWGREDGVEVVAVSRFGAEALAGVGLEAPVIPHGIDLGTFRPLVPGDRHASRDLARERLGWDPDRFVIGFVGANTQPLRNRKCLPEVLMAVGDLAARHDDVSVYLHAERDGRWGDGDDLEALAVAVGADRAELAFASDHAVRSGEGDDLMAARYNAFDVLVAPSATEGFCLPLIEAQACGVPVVASRWSAQTENVEAGWSVGGQPRWQPEDRRWWWSPRVVDIVAALDQAHALDRDGRAALADAGVSFARHFDHHELFAHRWWPLIEARLR